jgi:hypothetical protein
MAKTRLLERLTASDLFMLLWDDYGWPNQIGGLAILDGASLLDRDGHLRIEAVRRHIEPRLAAVPRFRQLLDRPRRGWAGPCGSTLPASTSPTTSASTRWPLPATRPSYCRPARNWPGGGWIQPGRCGSCGCCPACPSEAWARS